MCSPGRRDAGGRGGPPVPRRADQSDLHLTQSIAAIRESFEELGVLLARHADGRMATCDRHRGAGTAGPVCRAVQARGLTLAADRVFVLAHWVTDRDLPRRLTCRLAGSACPKAGEPVADEAEQFEPVWVRPADAPAAPRGGAVFHHLPDHPHAERLQHYATVDAVLTPAPASSRCGPAARGRLAGWPRGPLRHGA